jgi:hypothetical protein
MIAPVDRPEFKNQAEKTKGDALCIPLSQTLRGPAGRFGNSLSCFLGL